MPNNPVRALGQKNLQGHGHTVAAQGIADSLVEFLEFHTLMLIELDQGQARLREESLFALQRALAAIGRTDNNSAAVNRSICNSRTVTTSTVSPTALKTSRV